MSASKDPLPLYVQKHVHELRQFMHLFEEGAGMLHHQEAVYFRFLLGVLRRRVGELSRGKEPSGELPTFTPVD